MKNVYYQQLEDDVVRVSIELVHRQHWGYSIGYKGRFLVVSVKRQPTKLDIRKLTIAIDAGHGGTNGGTGGVKTFQSEKDLTLKYAKELEKLLVSLKRAEKEKESDIITSISIRLKDIMQKLSDIKTQKNNFYKNQKKI